MLKELGINNLCKQTSGILNLILSLNLIMIVFKFGGASINDANSIKNIGRILQNYTDELLVVVVSAMGKTTNELEAVVKAYLQQNDTHNYSAKFIWCHKYRN